MRFKARLLTGILVITPGFLSVFIIYYIFGNIDNILSPFLDKLFDTYFVDIKIPHFFVSVLSVFLLITGIFFIGLLAENFIGNTVIRWMDRILSRTPIIRGVYTAVKQFMEAFKLTSSNKFSKVVAVEYPKDDMWVIGFVTSEVNKELNEEIDTEGRLINVFIPTTPNPTSGYLVMVDKAKLRELDMSVEHAVKYIVSAGVLQKENGIQQSK